MAETSSPTSFERDSDDDEAPCAVSLSAHDDTSTELAVEYGALSHKDFYRSKPAPATIVTGCLGAGDILAKVHIFDGSIIISG